MSSFEELLAQYEYSYPESAIAQKPAEPRDSARLLVYSRKTGVVKYDVYRNITRYLPKGAVLVFNNTKVVPARLEVVKPSGGTARVLCVGKRDNAVVVMSDRKLIVGSEVAVLAQKDIVFTVDGQEEKYYVLRPHFSLAQLDAVLENYGTTPLPPYITEHGMKEDMLRSWYQTVFAEQQGSVAAPTASLHFTPELLGQVRAAGHEICYVTLHVGLGTFAPLTEKHVAEGVLHSERYSIPGETMLALRRAKEEGRPIIAVGTTVVRTLESSAASGIPEGETTLFIRDGFLPKIVDGLATNFHVPRSSLMMLVSTFVGREKLLELYDRAIKDGFRLFSFGDGMLIID